MKIVKTERQNLSHRNEIKKSLREEWGPPRAFVAFPETIVLPKANAVVTAEPQVPFKPDRIAIDQFDKPRHIFLNDVKIGKNSQRVDMQAANAALFPPIPYELTPKQKEEFDRLMRIDFDTVQIGQLFTINVENRGDEPFRFNAVVWGTILWERIGRVSG